MLAPDLSKEQILDALHRLNELLAAEGTVGELCLFGGAAMVLAFNARLSTRDVDATFKPSALVRSFAQQIADEKNLPKDWLNDGVKGFLSTRQDMLPLTDLEFSHLRIYRPSAEYLLAMKCQAARAPGPDTGGDRRDIIFLLKHLDLKNVDAVLKIVTTFFPPERIPAKTEFLLHEIITELSST